MLSWSPRRLQFLVSIHWNDKITIVVRFRGKVRMVWKHSCIFSYFDDWKNIASLWSRCVKNARCRSDSPRPVKNKSAEDVTRMIEDLEQPKHQISAVYRLRCYQKRLIEERNIMPIFAGWIQVLEDCLLRNTDSSKLGISEMLISQSSRPLVASRTY